MAQAVLITGGNLGDMSENMAHALGLIAQHVGRVTAFSKVEESDPWGFDAPQRFMNQVVVVETDLLPEQLLATTQQIEREMGRIRNPEQEHTPDGRRTYHSRTMDIDILFYDKLILSTPQLTIPHPMLHQRDFVLRPLSQVMNDYVHPKLGQSVGQLWATLNSKIECR